MKAKIEFVSKFSDILVKRKIINKKEAECIKKIFFDRSKNSFDYFLLDEGIITKDDLLKALSEYYQVPSIDVTGIFFDHSLLTNFPKDFLLRNMIIPYEVEGEILTVVANNPSNENLAEEIEKFTDFNVEFLVGLGQPILDAIEEYYDLPPEGFMFDTTDEDEQEDSIYEKNETVDQLIDEKRSK